MPEMEDLGEKDLPFLLLHELSKQFSALDAEPSYSA
jgi:hypothetical protein